jgi:hypothetical protein
MVIPVLHGITVDEAQLAISDSWSVLQKQDGKIKCQVRYLPSWENQETYLIPGY